MVLGPLSECLLPSQSKFTIYDPDGSMFENWKLKMCRWYRSTRRPKGNSRHDVSGGVNHSRFANPNRSLATLGHNTGSMHHANVAAPPDQSPAPPRAPGLAPVATPTVRYGPTYTNNSDLHVLGITANH